MDQQRAICRQRQLAVALLLASASILSLVIELDGQEVDSGCQPWGHLPDRVARNIDKVFGYKPVCSERFYELFSMVGHETYDRYLRNVKGCRPKQYTRFYEIFKTNAYNLLCKMNNEFAAGSTNVSLFNSKIDDVSMRQQKLKNTQILYSTLIIITLTHFPS